MPNQKPTILIVHGSWHTPAHFAPFLSALSAADYPTSCPALPSTQSLPHIGLHDDAACITAELSRLVEREARDVVVLAHSYGGVVATQAVHASFSQRARTEKGEAGGVLRIVYVCAFMLVEGQSLMGAFGLGPDDALPPFIRVDVRLLVPHLFPSSFLNVRP